MIAQIGSALTSLGPAGTILIGFLASVGGVAGVYGASVVRCRLAHGRECEAVGRR